RRHAGGSRSPDGDVLRGPVAGRGLQPRRAVRCGRRLVPSRRRRTGASQPRGSAVGARGNRRPAGRGVAHRSHFGGPGAARQPGAARRSSASRPGRSDGVIRINLATRPFYNERAVGLWLLLVAVVVAAATLFNISSVIGYSRSDTELAMQASRDEARAADLRQQAARLRATVDPRQIEFASTEARQANDLIDRRTFSWTELLNRFEETLPDDVRIVSIRPRLDPKTGIVLLLSIVARSVEDIEKFMDNLETTGAFAGTLTREDHVNEEGLIEATL